MNRTIALASATALLLVGAGCSTSAEPSGSTTGSSSAAAESQTLTVFAAASLKTTFTELGQQFESSHVGTKVTFSFAGSSDLVTQIQQGAPADVFASADTKNMDKATADNLVKGEPVNFASNTLEIAVPPDNPSQDHHLRRPGRGRCQGRDLRTPGAVRLGDAEGRDGDWGLVGTGQ